MAQALFDAVSRVRSQIHGHDFSYLTAIKFSLPEIKGAQSPSKDQQRVRPIKELSEELLGKLSMLQSGVLQLSGLGLTDGQMQLIVPRLATRTDLVTLKVAKNCLTDDSVKLILQKLPQLHSLNLCGNRLTPLSLDYLQKFMKEGTLGTVYLNRNNISRFKQRHREALMLSKGLKLII